MKIAYLAPEIPALSATFVYNEIFQLEKLGMEIQPFSVHDNQAVFSDPSLQDLKSRTHFLYQTPISSVITDQIKILLKRPASYIKGLVFLIKDMIKTGIFTRLSMGMLYRFVYSASLANQLIKQNCEHIHVHFAHVPTDLAMYAAILAGIEYSVTAHANDLFQRGWLLKEKVERAKFFITISEYNRQFLIAQGADGNKITVLHCGVDSAQFSLREDFIPSNIPKIGVVARLVEKKGIDHLINAVAHLKKTAKPYQLVIVGDGPLLDEHQALASSLGLSSKEITFLGAIDHQEIAAFIKSLDVFVLPCQKDSAGDMDGIPVVLMEAMLSGVPVISTPITGIPELIIQGETGLLASIGSESELTDCIEQSINDGELTKVRVTKGVVKVEMDFSLVKNSLRLYHLILAEEDKV